VGGEVCKTFLKRLNVREHGVEMFVLEFGLAGEDTKNSRTMGVGSLICQEAALQRGGKGRNIVSQL